MVRLENVTKRFSTKHKKVEALTEISFRIRKGEFVVVRGPSGSGKTTLLLTIGGMLHPTQGEVIVSDKNIYRFTEPERAHFRAENVGFVFQMFHLVPYLNIKENVMVPSDVSGTRSTRLRAEGLIERLGLADRITHKPAELSAGERQRTAIARALLNDPKLILADEPTGNLDPENAAEVIGYFDEYHRQGGTVIVVTHGEVADHFADRVVLLKDGRLQNENSS